MSESAIEIPSVDEYRAVVAATKGSILQFNRLGSLTFLTAFRGLGHFETIMWDDRHPDYRGKGTLVSYWPTLQTAESFHFAYLKQLLASPFGSEMRERGKGMKNAAKEAREEILSDKVLFKDYTDD